MSTGKLEKLIFGQHTIEKTINNQITDEKINEISIQTDVELEEWLNKKLCNSSKNLDLAYNTKYHIGLNATAFRNKYLNEILDINPYSGNLSDIQSDEFYEKNPNNISVRELQTMQPEIYKLGYVDRIEVNNILITDIILKSDNNKLKLESMEGFTLNEIAYLANNYIKLLLWNRGSFGEDARMFMCGEKHKLDYKLIFNVGLSKKIAPV